MKIGGGAWSQSLSIKKESPTKGVVVYMYSIFSLIGLDSEVEKPPPPSFLKAGGVHLVELLTVAKTFALKCLASLSLKS